MTPVLLPVTFLFFVIAISPLCRSVPHPLDALKTPGKGLLER
jgi:hypothetical protein